MILGKKEPKPTAWSDKKLSSEQPIGKDTFFDIGRDDSYYRDQNSELNLESIVSTPIIAISKANSVMLSGQLTFLLDHCFDKKTEKVNGKEKTVYRPQMIHLYLQVKSEEATTTNQEFTIIPLPVITLLPISSIGLEKVKIDFGMEITSISSYKNVKDGVLERKAQLSGKIGSSEIGLLKKREEPGFQFPNRTLNVSMEAAKLPLPIGILNMIDMMNKYSSL